MSTDSCVPQYSIFKDCLARRVLAEPGVLGQSSDDSDDSDALDDFTSYLADEIWPALPPTLQRATHENRSQVPDVDDLPLDSIPPSFSDTLVSCGLVPDADADSDSSLRFLRRVLKDYVAEACAPPPMWSKTRTTECEICEREVPLTYHHLIPREVHDKVLKKKWHSETMLNSVAWLCRSVSGERFHDLLPRCISSADEGKVHLFARLKLTINSQTVSHRSSPRR